MIANLNRLVYESSAPNRYATFFYGQYDAATGVLAYVNAGHNPPIVVRAAGGVDRLDTGGPVVGLLPECHYEQGCVRLDAGDVFVAFTDGVSEAMTGSYEEWGEERLLETIRAADGLRSPALIDRIMRGADAFVAGAAQHDDMTLVVVRRVEPAAAGDPSGV
jgi:sigma-B regulation protein RsbU (phosphoserine phosphatase)